ncbi:MAG: TonB family protein [Methylocystis sp.]|uniref:TonB family protein n=1 Tax=Methylocystis sp. TaxID=1911079 RepID=UPI003DA317A5
MNETVRQKPRGAAVAAVAMERLFEPRFRGAVKPRPRFLAFLILCLLLHLSILAFLLWEDKHTALPAPVEEIPVEVITEPPPPPQEEKKEEPPPPEPEQQQQEKQKPPPPPPPPPDKLEEPATDAPKLESKAKSEQDAPEEQKETKTPRKDTPTEKVVPKDEKPEALKDAEDDADGDKKPAPAPMKEIEDKPDAEVIEQAEKTPKPVEKPTPDPGKAARKGEGKTIAEMVAAMAPLPAPVFSAPPKTSPVGGGQAKTTYLTILYGLIMPHMRIPPRVRELPMSTKGVVAFYIDEMGNLTHQAVYKTSGLPDLDAAALAAVRAAAPFPPPPRGLPRAMLFSYATK